MLVTRVHRYLTFVSQLPGPFCEKRNGRWFAEIVRKHCTVFIIPTKYTFLGYVAILSRLVVAVNLYRLEERKRMTRLRVERTVKRA